MRTWMEKLKWDKGFEVNLSIKCEQRRQGLQPPPPSSHPDTVPEHSPTPSLSKQVQGIKTPLQPPHNRARASSPLREKTSTSQKAKQHKILTRKFNSQRPSVSGVPPKGAAGRHQPGSRRTPPAPGTLNWFPRLPEPGSVSGKGEGVSTKFMEGDTT